MASEMMVHNLHSVSFCVIYCLSFSEFPFFSHNEQNNQSWVLFEHPCVVSQQERHFWHHISPCPLLLCAFPAAFLVLQPHSGKGEIFMTKMLTATRMKSSGE